MTEQGFWDRVDIGGEDDCWPWLGCLLSTGYGQVYVGRDSGLAPGVLALTHRVAYQLAVGPIPPGLVLDHLCRRKSCCNPRHMETVTSRTNTVERADSTAGLNSRKTHCKHGHEFTPRNTYWRPSGGRECITCKLALRTIHNSRRRVSL